MKLKGVFLTLLVFVLATNLVFAADDGPLFRRNISRTPETMTGGAQISVMPLYVRAQNPLGELVTIEYLVGDKDSSTALYTRDYAKPLFSSYNDGIDVGELSGDFGIMTGAGFGERDAFGALSLDDGATWKNYNLSDSAARSSFVLANGEHYPGDVFKIVHAVEGNRVAVAWISRFCESGSPLYSWEDEDIAALLEDENYPALSLHEVVHPFTQELVSVYTTDLFGVAGSQDSVDYTLQGFPQVGEIPYGCVWVARGTLEEDPANPDVYDIMWRAAERLTSGRRDPHQINIASAPGAGFAIAWQEDPEGLRPGKGLGPGEGWSGAIANSKTDIWYTYVDWDYFDDVTDGDTVYYQPTGEDLFGFEAKPKANVPFAVPVRLTDNNQCKDPASQNPSAPYCYTDFDGNNISDLCETSTGWTSPGGNTLTICVAEDGRILTGQTASTRVRWALKPYDQDGDGSPDSAWVVMGEEKMKAMGDPDLPPEEIIDIGKDMWYHTFDMFNPELAQQGLMLNAPARDPETDEMFPVVVDEWGNDYYETEIARRFNLMVQGIGAAMDSEYDTSAILIYKEGIINQGGPADIFIRRVVLPDTFDPAVDNPFDYDNVVCDAFDGDDESDWIVTPADENPNYVKGLCGVQGMNMSGTTIVECDNGSTDCAADFPWLGGEEYPKVLEWRQCDGMDTTIPDCVQGESNFDDPSWVNPYDVSKGHRGFIDGDFVMMMYAMSPNWKANTVGNENYNLYVRRSFDGGQTWTTLPSSYTHIDGTTWTGDGTETCEWYGPNNAQEEVCTPYGAGAFEQARNVSQLTGSRITVLDPRYTPTGGMLKTDYSSLLCDDDGDGVWENCGYAGSPYPELDDDRDPSGYFVTYETGDNSVVDIDTAAVPLDMYYARAFDFGDDYDVIDVCGEDYPGSPKTCDEGETIERWDWLENGDELATEASVYGNPDGSKFYAVWNQELEIEEEVFTDMDVQFRRILYNLDSDAYPYATILYASHRTVSRALGGNVLLVGTARDRDRLGEGIVAYRWRSSLDGQLSGAQVLSIPAVDLSLGFHTISFQAQDNEGNWSTGATYNLPVAEMFHQVHMPIVGK